MVRSLTSSLLVRLALAMASFAVFAWPATLAAPARADLGQMAAQALDSPTVRDQLLEILPEPESDALLSALNHPGPARDVMTLQMAAVLDGQPGATVGGEPLATAMGLPPGSPMPEWTPPGVLASTSGAVSTLADLSRSLGTGALALVALALALGPRRPRILCRVGRWAVVSGTMAAVVSLVVRSVSTGRGALSVAAAVMAPRTGALVGRGVVLALAGAAVWALGAALRPAPDSPRRTVRRAPQPRATRRDHRPAAPPHTSGPAPVPSGHALPAAGPR